VINHRFRSLFGAGKAATASQACEVPSSASVNQSLGMAVRISSSAGAATASMVSYEIRYRLQEYVTKHPDATQHDLTGELRISWETRSTASGR
jgi:hypothetical protein